MTSNLHITMRLPVELVARIERYGRDIGLSKSEAYRAALTRGLETHERAKIDSAILHQVAFANAMLNCVFAEKHPDLVRKAGEEADRVVREIMGAN